MHLAGLYLLPPQKEYWMVEVMVTFFTFFAQINNFQLLDIETICTTDYITASLVNSGIGLQ